MKVWTEAGHVHIQISEDTVKTFSHYQKFNNTYELASALGVHTEAHNQSKTKEPIKNVSWQVSRQKQILTGDLWDYRTVFDNKKYNKILTEKFCCTPSKFLKLVNGVIHKTFISEKFEDKYVRMFCIVPRRTKFQLDPNLVHHLGVSYDKVKQADKDGLQHITPFVFLFNKDPKELKALFGNSVWKRLSKNSFSRNKKIIQKLPFGVYQGQCSGLKYLKNRISQYSELPTTLIQYIGGSYTYYETLKYVSNFKGIWSDREKVRSICVLYDDTLSMFEQLGEAFNPSWSLRRLKEEHDAASKKILLKDFSSDRFEWIPAGYPETFDHEGFTATLLDNRLAIAEEGKTMHHCVGSYAELSANGKYLVYSILDKDGNRYSTLGLRRRGDLLLSVQPDVDVMFDQHYRAFNQKVEDFVAKELESLIAQTLNAFESAKHDT